MYADDKRITDYINTLAEETETIKSVISDIAIFSEGSISYSEAKMMPFYERMSIHKLISKKIQAEQGKEYL